MRASSEGFFKISELTELIRQVDILVHSLANGPEVTKPLLETSRKGYLAASSASAYSLVSMVQRFGPIMPQGGAVISLSYVAAVRTIPGYGGGMSSAKAEQREQRDFKIEKSNIQKYIFLGPLERLI